MFICLALRMPTDAFNGPRTPWPWFLWANSSRTRRSPSIPANMPTIHESPKQSGYIYKKIHLLFFPDIRRSRQSLVATQNLRYFLFLVSSGTRTPAPALRFYSSPPAFPAPPGEKKCIQVGFFQKLSAQKQSRSNRWGERRSSRPSAGGGNGPARDSHESVSQFPPVEDETGVTKAPHCTSDVDDRQLELP